MNFIGKNSSFFLLLSALLPVACGSSKSSGTAAVATPVGDTVWTSMGFDLGSTYNNAGETILTKENAPTLKRGWLYDAGGTVNGAPVIVDDIAYLVSAAGTQAIDANTGDFFWENKDAKGESSAAFADGVVYVNDTRAVLHALSAADGTEIWKVPIDTHGNAAGYSSPLIYENFVVIGSSSNEEATQDSPATFRGSVAAFDKDTGAMLWQHYTLDPPFNGATIWSSPSIDPDTRTVFASTGNNYTDESTDTSDSIMALSLDTGDLIWNTQVYANDIFTISRAQSPDNDFGANPVLFTATIDGQTRKMVGAGNKQGIVFGLDRETGAIVWQTPLSPNSALTGGMLNNTAFDGKHILVSGNQGTSTGDGSEDSNKESSGGVSSTSRLAALDPATGAILWERQLPAFVWAPISVANGVGFVSYESHIQAFDTDTGTKLFTYQTEATIACTASISNGRVFVGSGMAYITGRTGTKVHMLTVGNAAGTMSGGVVKTGATTLSAIYDEVLVPRGCNSTSCHGGGQGNLTLNSKEDAYSQLVKVPAQGSACAGSGVVRVVPKDPDHSLLVDKVSNPKPACGDPMPETGDGLSQDEIDQIRGWIMDGALDN